MNPLPAAAGGQGLLPSRFWQRVSAARHRVLMLDHDGTIAPFHHDPLAAAAAPGTLALLEDLARDPRTTVAVVSGRPLAQLDHLLGTARVVRVAEHGWEVRWPDGRRLVHAVPIGTTRALEAAAAAAESSLRAGAIERKRCGVVLHTRGLDEASARVTEIACRAIWAGPARNHGLRLDRIDGGLELRARGRDKGDVVRWLLAAAPPGSLPVYLGDDLTDEDAFRVVLGRGFAIRVGPAERASAARLRLASVEEVVEFLEEWLHRAGPGRRPAGRGR